MPISRYYMQQINTHSLFCEPDPYHSIYVYMYICSYHSMPSFLPPSSLFKLCILFPRKFLYIYIHVCMYMYIYIYIYVYIYIHIYICIYIMYIYMNIYIYIPLSSSEEGRNLWGGKVRWDPRSIPPGSPACPGASINVYICI
jgi:hypothetical protein